jgi:hypothetical protein
MSRMITYVLLALTTLRSSPSMPVTTLYRSQMQTAAVQSGAASDDPLGQIRIDFPKSIEVKNQGHLVEFCQEDICDGFVSSRDVSVTTLRDFTYLYIYFFSMNATQEWRQRDEPKRLMERVLARPEYRSCRRDDDLESARCVLLNLSRDGKINLILIRYDEGHRNVARQNIIEQLSKKGSQPKK